MSFIPENLEKKLKPKGNLTIASSRQPAPPSVNLAADVNLAKTIFTEFEANKSTTTSPKAIAFLVSKLESTPPQSDTMGQQITNLTRGLKNVVRESMKGGTKEDLEQPAVKKEGDAPKKEEETAKKESDPSKKEEATSQPQQQPAQQTATAPTTAPKKPRPPLKRTGHFKMTDPAYQLPSGTAKTQALGDGKYNVSGQTYTKGKQIGSQSCMGVVNLLDPTKEGQRKLVMKTAKSGAEEGLEKEARVYKQVGDHENVMKFVGTVDTGKEKGLILEHVGGGDLEKAYADLKKMLDTGKITYAQYMGTVQYLMKGALKGFAHLASKGIVHHDVKLDNVMLDDKTLQPKVFDFGTSMLQGDKEEQQGNIGGLGPEKFQGGNTKDWKSTPKMDVFGVGQSIHRMTEGNLFKGVNEQGKEMGRFPMMVAMSQFGADAKNQATTKMGKTEQASLGRLHDQKGKAALDEWKLSGAPKGELGQKIEDANKRPIEKHGADTSYTKLMNQMLTPTAEGRVSAEDALKSDFFKDALLSDEGAQGVLKQMLAGREAAKTGADKPAPVQQPTKGKTPTKAPKTSTAVENLVKEGMKAGGVSGYFNTKKAVSEQKKGQKNMLKELTTKKPPLKTPPKDLIKDRSAPNLAMATEQMVKKTKEEVKQESTE